MFLKGEKWGWTQVKKDRRFMASIVETLHAYPDSTCNLNRANGSASASETPMREITRCQVIGVVTGVPTSTRNL